MPTSRITADVAGSQTIRIEHYNNLREEAKASSYLLAYGDTQTAKIYVSPGIAYVGSDRIDFVGAQSALITNPTASNRIDLHYLTATGALTVLQGTEDDSPTAPATPLDSIPIVLVYNRSGQTVIDDSDQAGADGYIQDDMRPQMVDLGSRWKLLAVSRLSATSTALLNLSSIDTDYDMFRINFFVLGDSSTTTRLELQLNGELASYNQEVMKAAATSVTSVLLSDDVLRLVLGDISSSEGPAIGECTIIKPIATVKGGIIGSSKERAESTTEHTTYSADWTDVTEKISAITIFTSGSGALQIGSFASVEGMKTS